MKKLWNQRGEMLVESLISMLIIAMTGMMIAMAAASAMNTNIQADQKATFSSVSPGAPAAPAATDILCSAEWYDDANPIGAAEIGVTVKNQEGLYYYEKTS